MWGNLPVVAGIFAIYLGLSKINGLTLSNFFNAGEQALYRTDIIMLIVLNIIICLLFTYLLQNFLVKLINLSLYDIYS